MYGKTMGELSVYIKDDGGSRRMLWTKKGDQGNKWISGEATISNVSNTDYQVSEGQVWIFSLMFALYKYQK